MGAQPGSRSPALTPPWLDLSARRGCVLRLTPGCRSRSLPEPTAVLGLDITLQGRLGEVGAACQARPPIRPALERLPHPQRSAVAAPPAS